TGHRFLTGSDDHISVSQCDHTAGINDGTCTTETYFIDGNAVYIATNAGVEGSLSPRVLACASLNYLCPNDGIHSIGGDTSRANSPPNRVGGQIDSGRPRMCTKSTTTWGARSANNYCIAWRRSRHNDS